MINAIIAAGILAMQPFIPPAPPTDCKVSYYVSTIDYPWFTVIGFQFMGIRKGDIVEELLIPVDRYNALANADPYWLPEDVWIGIGFRFIGTNQYAVMIRSKGKSLGPLPVRPQ